jgi:cyclophilin family peptidyl-prolyl cis-trans isomerase
MARHAQAQDQIRRLLLTVALAVLLLTLLAKRQPGSANRELQRSALVNRTGSTGSSYKVKFELSHLDGQPGDDHKGSFVVEVHDEWSPLGAARFKEMVDSDFFKGVRFFRVINGFMAQFGIHGEPSVAAEWKQKTLQDDPVVESNARGFVSFATSGLNSRTTQMFINFGNNVNLDSMGFSPFARVVAGPGMDAVDRIFQVGEKPNQGEIESKGNAYLTKHFPQLTEITSAKLMQPDVPPLPPLPLPSGDVSSPSHTASHLLTSNLTPS